MMASAGQGSGHWNLQVKKALRLLKETLMHRRVVLSDGLGEFAQLFLLA
jgi:hypothetical protein